MLFSGLICLEICGYFWLLLLKKPSAVMEVPSYKYGSNFSRPRYVSLSKCCFKRFSIVNVYKYPLAMNEPRGHTTVLKMHICGFNTVHNAHSICLHCTQLKNKQHLIIWDLQHQQLEIFEENASGLTAFEFSMSAFWTILKVVRKVYMENSNTANPEAYSSNMWLNRKCF